MGNSLTNNPYYKHKTLKESKYLELQNNKKVCLLNKNNQKGQLTHFVFA